MSSELRRIMNESGIDRMAAYSEQYDDSITERSLVSAVLWRALEDLHHRERNIRREAVFWFSDEKESPFSFYWCCSTLDIPVVEITQKIEKMGLFEWTNPPNLKGFEGLADRWCPGFPLGASPRSGVRRLERRRAASLNYRGPRLRRGKL